VSHPVKQGLIQSLGVFVDTMIICTATALIILVSGPSVYDPHTPSKMAGASLTASAVAANLGSWTTWLTDGSGLRLRVLLGAGQLRLRGDQPVLPRGE
jgi:Na+/alanine symporter